MQALPWMCSLHLGPPASRTMSQINLYALLITRCMVFSCSSRKRTERDVLYEWGMKLLEASSRQNKDFILDNKCHLKLRNILMKRKGFEHLLHINYCSLFIDCSLCIRHHSVCFLCIPTYWIIIKKERCDYTLLTDERNEAHGCSIQP